MIPTMLVPNQLLRQSVSLEISNVAGMMMKVRSIWVEMKMMQMMQLTSAAHLGNNLDECPPKRIGETPNTHRWCDQGKEGFCSVAFFVHSPGKCFANYPQLFSTILSCWRSQRLYRGLLMVLVFHSPLHFAVA